MIPSWKNDGVRLMMVGKKGAGQSVLKVLYLAPQVICGWCGVVLKDGGKPASHGICLPCDARMYAEASLDVISA